MSWAAELDYAMANYDTEKFRRKERLRKGVVAVAISSGYRRPNEHAKSLCLFPHSSLRAPDFSSGLYTLKSLPLFPPCKAIVLRCFGAFLIKLNLSSPYHRILLQSRKQDWNVGFFLLD